MWHPWQADDWDRENDGPTPQKMAEAAFQEEQERLQQQRIDARLWEMAVNGFFTRDGDYIGPRND